MSDRLVGAHCASPGLPRVNKMSMIPRGNP